MDHTATIALAITLPVCKVRCHTQVAGLAEWVELKHCIVHDKDDTTLQSTCYVDVSIRAIYCWNTAYS